MWIYYADAADLLVEWREKVPELLLNCHHFKLIFCYFPSLSQSCLGNVDNVLFFRVDDCSTMLVLLA